MELVVNLLALAATCGVAYMGTVLGAYRSGMALVACLIAGAVAFGLFGPVAGLLPAESGESVWYYTADALALWALFAVTFLGLRTLGEKFLPAQSHFPAYADKPVGGILGLGTAYIVVGICLVVLQMMPVQPNVVGGYSAFRFDGRENEVDPEDELWLKWDRGVLGLYQYLLSGPLGAAEGGVFARYGDVYPPKQMRQSPQPEEGEGGAERSGEAEPSTPRRTLPGEGVVNADDVLYYHWYRRYQYIQWRIGRAQGPIPDEAALEAQRPGLRLQPMRESEVMNGLDTRVVRTRTYQRIHSFDEVRIDATEKFLQVTVEFQPAAGQGLPMTVESDSFVLLDPDDERSTRPMILGKARRQEEEAEPTIQPGTAREMPSELTVIGEPRYHFPPRRSLGDFLLEGARFLFTDRKQTETRMLVFIVPVGASASDLRLLYEPGGPPAPPESEGGAS